MRLAAKLEKMPDDVSFMPFHLEENVSEFYMEMSKDDQLDMGKIEAWLKQVFIDGQPVAYNKMERVRCTRVQMNVYMTG